MITCAALARFAEGNGWLVVDEGDDYVRYLTPEGNKVLVEFSRRDGRIVRIYP